MSDSKDDGSKSLLIGVAAGGSAALIARLLAPKPALAAEGRWGDLLASQAAIIDLLERLIAAMGGVPPGVDVTIKTPWIAKDPEQIYSNAIRSIGTFLSDIMVNYTEGKRLVFVVQSSLNQACNIQLIGNYVDDTNRAVNIDGVLPCPANTSISIGLAWDDWMPFIGVRITTAVAPTAGILNIWAVIQE